MVAIAALLLTNNANREQLGLAVQQQQLAVKQQALAERGQITERITKAVEELGSDRIDVRLGGIYALARIMLESPGDEAAVVGILSAFVRDNSVQPASPSQTPPKIVAKTGGCRPEPRTDVQAAVNVIGERRSTESNPFGPGQSAPKDSRIQSLLDLSHADLTCAILYGKDLRYSYLHLANLTYATLNFATLCAAAMEEANLTGAVLQNTDLRRAYLVNAILLNANLGGANLSRADLGSAKLSGANLDGANLTGAWLTGVDLSTTRVGAANLAGADLRFTNLRGVNLEKANLTGTILDGAHTDSETRFPPGFVMRTYPTPFGSTAPKCGG